VTALIKPAPVRASVTVAAPQAKAFEVFTAEIGRWWKRTGTGIGKSPMRSVTLEPFVGGRWFEIGEDGVETDWGHVLEWQPSERLLLAWQIGPGWKYDPKLVTEVELRFIPEGADRTRVELEHRHLERMGEGAERVREAISSPKGWNSKLAAFAEEAGGSV
jgi:uncharacterized protein YndB with AHSA1/START domain